MHRLLVVSICDMWPWADKQPGLVVPLLYRESAMLDALTTLPFFLSLTRTHAHARTHPSFLVFPYQHFIFFALEFDLLARKEMDPLEALVTPLVEEFNRGTIST